MSSAEQLAIDIQEVSKTATDILINKEIDHDYTKVEGVLNLMGQLLIVSHNSGIKIGTDFINLHDSLTVYFDKNFRDDKRASSLMPRNSGVYVPPKDN